MPGWGVGVLVATGHQQRTYLFADGSRRTFKEDFIAQFIESAPPPDEVAQQRIERGAKSVAMPKAINLALEAQIKAAPGDADAFMIYGDWLQEQGDPRGELVAIQRHLERAPGDKQVKKAEAALLAKHGAYLVPPLLWQMVQLPKRGAERNRSEITWRAGFIDRVRIARASDRAPALRDVLHELLHHPAAQFMRSLTIGPLGTAKRFDYRPVVSEIAKAKPAALEELVVGDFGPNDIELDYAMLGNAYPMLAACTNLRRLVLRASSARFDSPIKHANLRELLVTAGTITERTLENFFAAALPALETLELACPGLRLTTAEADLLASATGMPKLQRLALRQSMSTSVLVASLLGRPLLRQLRELDLSGGDLEDGTVMMLVHRQDAIRHLRVLDVGGNQITPSRVQLLAGLTEEVRVDEQRTPGVIDAGAVLALAPDAASGAAARKLARPDRGWLAIGRDGNRLWGEFEGSDFYYVMATVNGQRMGCSCASAKDPCKHALALLLMATQHHIAESKIPEAVVRNTQSRTRWFEHGEY